MSYSAMYVKQISTNTYQIEDGFSANVAVITANNPQEAIDKLKEQYPIITDDVRFIIK